jgi:hypothetical protein
MFNHKRESGPKASFLSGHYFVLVHQFVFSFSTNTMMNPNDKQREGDFGVKANMASRNRVDSDDGTISFSRSLDLADDEQDPQEEEDVHAIDDKSIFQRAYDLIDFTARRFRRPSQANLNRSNGQETGLSRAAVRAQAKDAGVYADRGNGKSGRRPAALVPGAEYVQSRAPGLSAAFYLRFLRREISRPERAQQGGEDVVVDLEAPAEDSPVVAHCDVVPTTIEKKSWWGRSHFNRQTRVVEASNKVERVALEESELKQLRQECCITATIVYVILVVIVVGEVIGFHTKQ